MPPKPKPTSNPPSLPPTALLHTLSSLLTLELTAETSQNALLLSSHPPALLARAGLALLNLAITSYRTGLGGRTVLELGLDPAVVTKGSEGELPEHGIRTGDIVRVGERPREGGRKREVREAEGRGVEGVVVRVGRRGVWVALGGRKKGGGGDDDEGGVEGLPDGKLWLVKLANDVTYRRMEQTLTKLLKTPEESYTTLQRVLFGLSHPSPPTLTSPAIQSLKFLDHTLNPSQQDAIRFALASPDLSLIHGPPGTGKTYTLIELIRQFHAQGKRVLVCGPSNISVDNIVERLAQAAPSIPIVRLGHPARLLPGVLNHSLEVLTRTSEQARLVGDVRRDIDEKMGSVRRVKGRAAKAEVWREVRELRREYREREGRVTRELVGGAKVVLSTLHGAGGRDAKAQEGGGGGYDVLVVDEAAQAVEPQCWVPIVMAGEIGKVVLAGDHMQLPPTVKGKDAEVDKEEEKKRVSTLEEELGKLSLEDVVVKKAKQWSLATTMFDRLLGLYGNDIKRLLNVQYRMHERIMRFPSDELYDGELVAADGVEARLLKDLEYEVEDTDDTREPLVFYDTQGGDFQEKTEALEGGKVKKSALLGDSKSNAMEAAVVNMHVKALVAAGVKDEDIAVVTPYNAQLATLSGMLRDTYPGLELGSVDGFQGREKEAVIVSLVRSNPEREVGFLGEKRRLNVAMTRPKRHLCIIGDSETVSRGSAFLKRWMKFLEDNADLRYPTLGELDMA